MRSESPRHRRRSEPSLRVIDPAVEQGGCVSSEVTFYTGSVLLMAALVGLLCAPAYFVSHQLAVNSYTFITDEAEPSGATRTLPIPRRIFVAERNPLGHVNSSRRNFLVKKWGTTRLHKVLGAPHAHIPTGTTTRHPHVSKDPHEAHNASSNKNGGEQPEQLLCFFGATFDGPWPTRLCSHLVYCGASLDASDKWLQLDARPGARRALNSFLALKAGGADEYNGGHPGRPLLVMGVQEPPTPLGAADTNQSWPLAFAEPGRARDLARRGANWLSNRRLDGLALLEQRLDPARIDAYLTILREFRTAFSGKLLLLFSIFWLYDMENRVKNLFLERRIKDLIRLTDFTLLETHMPPHKEGECVTFLPNSFSRSPSSQPQPFAMNAVLAWMDRAASQVDHGSVCFTLTLAVMRFLLPLEHSSFGEPCQDFYPVSYMQASVTAVDCLQKAAVS
ncbi:uncharacterized protein LOC144095269 [Amblyomma americanum]